MISLNIFDCKSYQPKHKRSVFDMIPNFDKENNTNEGPTEIRSHISVLGKAVRDVNGKEYQELENIFLEHRTKNKKLKQRRKGDLKKQFMEESKRRHESKLVERKRNKIIVNFYFLTKLV